MKTEDVFFFLTSYTLVVAFAVVAQLLRRREAMWLITATVALGAVCATTVVGFYLDPGTSYTSLILELIRHHDFSSVVSLAMGVSAALVWIVQLTEAPRHAPADGSRGWIRNGARQILLAASVVGVVVGGQAFIWKNLLGTTRDSPVRALAPEFVIEKIAAVAYKPVRVTVSDNGKVYVSYGYFESWGDMGGGIIQISQDAESREFQQKVVADSTLLMRSYGLAARDGDLFVSRSGICAKASMGKVTYEATGAVTQLKDLDNDGYFEYAKDVVTGLPGARGPDTMQQNNGIAFAPDGSVFLTSGCAANRALDEHPWGGTVLRVSPDFTQTEIFASGFRNPFGIVIGPDDEVFATDNDIDENPGDELNHVVRGAHYGHPYVVPNEASVEASGFHSPIFLSERESNFLGMVYATSPALPEPYRNCLYLADYMQHKILRLTLERDGGTYKVTGVYPFASLMYPTDIAVTPSGEFFVISHETQNVYRIRLKSAATK